jgi:hypothetical protein
MDARKMRGVGLLTAVAALAVGGPVWARKDASPTVSEVASMRTGPQKQGSGAFQGLAHETSGMASVYQLEDGRRVLRLEDLRTSNGPDLRVYLVEGDDATNDEAIKAGHFVELGRLKGNIGNQNYEIPADVDLSRYQSVSIWCERFSVNFAAATLMGALEGRSA